jgi:hypothetical protein
VDFPPTARIDTRLTIVDWPLTVDEELEAAVAGITTFELANDARAVVEDGLTRHLAWRGYLTGGLLTLYERLGSLLSDRGLSAFYADPRLEAFVPADREVVVLGALRHPIRIDRADWDARVAAADDGSELAEGFIRSALEGASGVIEQARHAAQEEPGTLGAPRPEAIEQLLRARSSSTSWTTATSSRLKLLGVGRSGQTPSSPPSGDATVEARFSSEVLRTRAAGGLELSASRGGGVR